MEKIGVFAWGKNFTLWGDLYPLDDFDINEYKHVDLKEGEELFRYRTEKMLRPEWCFLIKINPEKGRAYFLSDRGQELDRAFFETKGEKCKVTFN